MTTGIVIDSNGTIRPVPINVVTRDTDAAGNTNDDARSFVVISSLTSSTYSVIWNSYESGKADANWAEEAVCDMGSRLIVSGIEGYEFDSDREMKRDEFAAIVTRALGLKLGMGINLFADIEEDDWYSDYIKTAHKYGVVSGYGNDRFEPNDKITRQEALAITARAMKITEPNAVIETEEVDKLLASFGDTGEVDDWARGSIASCIKIGIVIGKPGNIIALDDTITGADAAVTVRRLLQKSGLI
jgi:hypothetical protein